MKRSAWFAAFFLLALPANATRIKDMSLSPEETMQQPNNILNAPAPLGGQPASRDAPLAGGNLSGDPSGRFMDGYCDSSIQPIIQNANTMQACLQETRADACQRFHRLPREAQAALDRAIACGYATGESGAPPSDCADSSSRQLQLLKKYWSDQETSYALVFLPDKVNNPAADCAGRQLKITP